MALRHIKSYLCDRCGQSTEQICEVWTRGSKEYCSRRCLDADRLKAASRKSSSRAYIGFAFIIALLAFAIAATPRTRAQGHSHHLHHADYYPNGISQAALPSAATARKRRTARLRAIRLLRDWKSATATVGLDPMRRRNGAITR